MSFSNLVAYNIGLSWQYWFLAVNSMNEWMYPFCVFRASFLNWQYKIHKNAI